MKTTVLLLSDTRWKNCGFHHNRGIDVLYMLRDVHCGMCNIDRDAHMGPKNSIVKSGVAVLSVEDTIAEPLSG